MLFGFDEYIIPQEQTRLSVFCTLLSVSGSLEISASEGGSVSEICHSQANHFLQSEGVAVRNIESNRTNGPKICDSITSPQYKSGLANNQSRIWKIRLRSILTNILE